MDSQINDDVPPTKSTIHQMRCVPSVLHLSRVDKNSTNRNDNVDSQINDDVPPRNSTIHQMRCVPSVLHLSRVDKNSTNRNDNADSQINDDVPPRNSIIHQMRCVPSVLHLSRVDKNSTNRNDNVDSQINDDVPPRKSIIHQMRCVPSVLHLRRVDKNSTNRNDNVQNIDDRTALIIDRISKFRKHSCQCSLSEINGSKSNAQHFHPWITFMHIICTAALAILAIYLVSNVLIFGKEKNEKEMDDITWRHTKPPFFTTGPSPPTSSTEMPLPKDKCEPLYVLVYANCFVWFLFLVLDHVARHIHHKTLRSRGHLRAYARLSRLAAIPFQLVSLWTVLLAIFIAVYAQQDEADLQPYCDANMLISPKNGIAVLLVIEFICVTISSLLYANSIRKFNFEKPPPDVCGWDENNYCDRWTPQILQSHDATINEQTNSEGCSIYDQRDGRCLLDLLEYYTHANHELSANLGQATQKLRQLEIENQSQQPSQSLD